MSTIRETVTEHLRAAGLGSYGSQAEPVIGALEDREYTAARTLINFAVDQGLSYDLALDAVQNAGLSVRPEANDTSELETDLSTLVTGVETLTRSLAELADAVDGLRSRRAGQSSRR